MYTNDELTQIILRSASVLNAPCEEKGAMEIARRSRGTPRIANRLLKRLRDYALVIGNGTITEELAKSALDMLAIDPIGLDDTDRRILEAIIIKFGGGPVGLDTLSASTGEEAGTIEDVCEPFLLQQGFIARTPRGRIATENAYSHLGIPHKK